MFDDFRPQSMSREERARMGGSVAAASLIYAGVAALVLGGTAATHAVVENLTQVEFVKHAPEPPPPPPPPETPAVAPENNARPKAKRKELKPPKEVPQDKPKESNDALKDDDSGPVDGFLNGVEGGTGTAAAAKVAPPPPPPPAKPEPVVAPVPLNNAAPQYSSAARRKEIEGVVVVAFDVLENGTVANVKIVSGPDELRENVLKTVATWHFKPATRGGKPIRHHMTKPIRFVLSDD
jgi:periplasmic protein TonB